jgi:hypothetical protein
LFSSELENNEDKNAYRTAKNNADEVARKYIKAREECCYLM